MNLTHDEVVALTRAVLFEINDWRNTPEGEEFWIKLHEKLDKVKNTGVGFEPYF